MAHLILLAGTFALAVDYYEGANYPIPQWLKWFVIFGVVGISMLWTLGHVIGGSIMGYAGGAMLDGMRMGLLLGGAWSIGRLWPYVMLWAAAAFFFAPSNLWWHTVLGILLGLALMVLHFGVKYIWGRLNM